MNEVGDDYVMPFGKWQGKEIGNVPANYLLWLYDQDWLPSAWPEVASYIARNYKSLVEEVERASEIREEY